MLVLRKYEIVCSQNHRCLLVGTTEFEGAAQNEQLRRIPREQGWRRTDSHAPPCGISHRIILPGYARKQCNVERTICYFWITTSKATPAIPASAPLTSPRTI
jgi:hypothetical protein